MGRTASVAWILSAASLVAATAACPSADEKRVQKSVAVAKSLVEENIGKSRDWLVYRAFSGTRSKSTLEQSTEQLYAQTWGIKSNEGYALTNQWRKEVREGEQRRDASPEDRERCRCLGS